MAPCSAVRLLVTRVAKQPHDRRVLAHERQERVTDGPQRLGGVRVRLGWQAHPAEDVVGHAVEDLVLAAEVAVERHRADPEVGGEPADGEPVEVALGIADPQRRLDDPLRRERRLPRPDRRLPRAIEPPLCTTVPYVVRGDTDTRPGSPRTAGMGTMAGVEPREIVDTYLDVIRTGDLDRLDDMLSPDIYDHVGQRRGIAWWKEILGSLSGGFSDQHVVVHHVLVDGDMVAVHLTVEGVHTGRFLPQIGPVEPTGKPFAWSHIHLFRVADGLAVEHWAVRDDIGLAKQVGIL